MNVRCTVSGGLEELAYQEIQAAFRTDVRLYWIQRGQSGSQLGVEFVRSSEELNAGTQAILKLRFSNMCTT